MKRWIWISGIIVLVLVGSIYYFTPKGALLTPSNQYQEDPNTVTVDYGSQDEDYQVTVGAKDACVRGQESEPIKEGAQYIVEIYDENCNVIDRKECVDDGRYHFVKNGGFWECERK